MLSRILHRKNNYKMIRYFATHKKPPNPNNQDFGPFIIVSLIYLGIDLAEKFIEYKKYNKK